MGALQRFHRRPLPAIPEIAAPQNPEELRKLVSAVITEVRSGRLDSRVANSVALLASVLLKAIDASDFQRRLCAVEAVLHQRGAQLWKT